MHPPGPPQRRPPQGPGDVRSHLQDDRPQATLSGHVHLQRRHLSVARLRCHAGEACLAGSVRGALSASRGASEAIVDRTAAGHLAGIGGRVR